MPDQLNLPGFLASRLARDAGKQGVIKKTALKIPLCSRCRQPLGRSASGEVCFSCTWTGGEQSWGWDKSWVPPAGARDRYQFYTQPYGHQLAALLASAARPTFALLMEMGTGKTKVILDDWAARVAAKELMDLLIVAPAGCYRNWERELVIHRSPEFNAQLALATWISGMGVQRTRQLEWVLGQAGRRPRVLLMNVEALSSVPRAREVCLDFLAPRRAMMCLDESTVIRTHDSNRTKHVLEMGPLSRVRRIATGLPTPQSPLDLFSQFEFLDPKILGFKSYFGFRARYAIMRQMAVNVPGPTDDDEERTKKINVVVGYRHVEELRDNVRDFSFRVLKSDCLDLPAKIYERWDVDLTPEQTRAYGEMRKHATTMLDNGRHITATSAITILTRLQQIALGYVVDEERVLQQLPHRRLDQLMEIITERQGKCIIWAPYLHSLQAIEKALFKSPRFGAGSYVRYWGEIGAAEKNEAPDRFQNDPNVRVFLGNPSSGGRGITLTQANLVVYYANSWDLEHRLQSEDRPHRSGLKHSVTYIDMVAPGTCEDKLLQCLRNKMDLAAAITGEGPRPWLI